MAKDKEHPFKVMAQGVEVNVLGTHFNVNAYPERTDVVTTLVEGKVRVGRGTRQIVLVPVSCRSKRITRLSWMMKVSSRLSPSS